MTRTATNQPRFPDRRPGGNRSVRRPSLTRTRLKADPAPALGRTPGQHGSFYAGYSDVPTGTQRCRTSAFVEVTPPNDFKHFTLALKIQPCGGRITVGVPHDQGKGSTPIDSGLVVNSFGP